VTSQLSRAWAAASTRRTDSTRAPFAEFYARPIEFVEQVLGWRPWGAEDSPTGAPGQREWLASLASSGRTLACTCHGPGKTRLSAAAVLWFMQTRRNCTVVTVAPTWPQVVKLTWAQIRAEHAEARRPIPGPPPLTHQWEIAPRWSASGFSTDDYTRASGIHAHTAASGEEGEMLVILEEASGIEPFIFRAMDGWLTKGKCYVLQIGNPKFKEGDFYAASKSGVYEVFHCSAFDAPRFVIQQRWIDDQRRTLEDRGGDESDYYWQTQVLGQFAERAGDLALFPSSLLEAAKDARPGEHTDAHVGYDVARFGEDRNVVTLTRGEVVEAVEAWRGLDLSASRKRLMDLCTSWGVGAALAHRIHVDVGGPGAGLVDAIREAGWQVDAVDFGAKTRGDWRDLLGPVKCANRKAELFRVGHELLKRKRASIPARFRSTWEQLGWIRGDYRPGTDTFFIEPKKDLKVEVGESPDFADSWALSLSRAVDGVRVWRL
jgi:hypothetical protein